MVGCNSGVGLNKPGVYLTPYDPSSIMNYSYCTAASAGILSAYDIMGVHRLNRLRLLWLSE